MKLNEIIKILEENFPLSSAYEWDNVGLLIGDKNRDVSKILLTLDTNIATINEAISLGADLILSHHPILFGGTKKITADTSEGRALMLLLENKISVYAAHTNCDVAKNGINERIAQIFSLKNVENLEENGLGRIGFLKEKMTLSEFAKLSKKLLNTPFVRIAGDENKIIEKVAIGSGACSDSIPVAILKNADVMVTADMKYHNMINFSEEGIAIIDAGHYPTEIVVMDIFEEILKTYNIELFKSKNPDIFKFI